MTRFLPDTSCIVAALCGWHEHHERAARELGRRLDSGEALVVAAPALVETYAVLTRLPSPHRLSPADSQALLEANFLSDVAEVVALEAEEYPDVAGVKAEGPGALARGPRSASPPRYFIGE